MHLNGITVGLYERDGTNWFRVPGRLVDGEARTSAIGGYKSASVTFEGGMDLLAWFYRLGKWFRLWAPGRWYLFEGTVEELAFEHGETFSLVDHANAVRVVFTDDTDQYDTTGWATDAELIDRYGRREYIHSGSYMTAAAAQNLRDTQLLLKKRVGVPDAFSLPPVDIPLPLRVQVLSYGWYAALNWLRWVNLASGPADTGLQIQGILDACDYVTWDESTVESTGIGIEQERLTTFLTQREEIERLSALGDSSGNVLMPQVWEDRVMRLQVWAESDGSPDYFVDRRGVRDANGTYIPYYAVRADRVIHRSGRQLPIGFSIANTSPGDPRSGYIVETVYNIREETLEVTLAGHADILEMLTKKVVL